MRLVPFRQLPRFVTLLVFAVLPTLAVLRAQDQPAPPPPPPNPFFFHDGDTPVVFLGEGTTEQRMYTTLIETYTLTRFPDWKITFRNAGWEDDTSGLTLRGGLDTGLGRDVLPLQPKAVTVSFGLSEAHEDNPSYFHYLDHLDKLVKDLEGAGARVALITPAPKEGYEFQAPAGSQGNLLVKKFVDGMKIVTDNERVPFIDVYSPLLNFIEAGRKSGLLSSTGDLGDSAQLRLTLDGVHPNWGGHFMMAAIILQGLKAQAAVSSVTVDAAAQSIVDSQACTVEWQKVPNGAIQLKRTDEAMPWPIPDDPTIGLAFKFPGFDPATTLNRYILKVTGLPQPSYKLTIDGKEIGVYASTDLASGVNLGFVRQGPIYDQGQLLLQAVMDKNDAYYNRWRNVQLYQPPPWLKGPGVENARAAEIARLDKVVSDAEASIETLRKPAPHIFRLDPVAVTPATAPAPAK